MTSVLINPRNYPYVNSPGANPAAASRFTNAARRLLTPVIRVKKPIIRPTINPPGVIGPSVPTPPAAPSFYPFVDYYANLIAQLGKIKDSQLAGLRSDITGRQNAVNDLIDKSRPILNQNYTNAINESAAVSDAVANRLAAQGTGGTEDLRSKLAALGQDPSAATSDLAKYYSGLGNANYAANAGDIQDLIGRKAEENTLLNKQPLIVQNQLNQDYSNNAADLINNYLSNVMDLSTKGAESKAAYDQAKFEFNQNQANTKLDQQNQAVQLYYDNYWKNQDLLFKRWQTQIASGDKKAANATKKQIANLQNQAKLDVANIKANASYATATKPKALQGKNINGHAVTFDPNSGTYYYQGTQNPVPQSVLDKWGVKKTTTATSNINKQRAYTAALNSIIDTKTGIIKAGINPTGYNADWTMTRTINAVLKSYGIYPDSPQGKNIRASVMSQASGRKFAQDNTARFKYDPNWVKGAKASYRKAHRGK